MRGEHRVLRVARTIADLERERARAGARRSARRWRCARRRRSARSGVSPRHASAARRVRACRAAQLAAGGSGAPLDHLRARPRAAVGCAGARGRRSARGARGPQARRRAARPRYEQFTPESVAQCVDAVAICRHAARFPRALTGRSAPHRCIVAGAGSALAAGGCAGGGDRWERTAASDYGMEMAATLARGLAAGGVTVSARRRRHGGGGSTALRRGARRGRRECRGDGLAGCVSCRPRSGVGVEARARRVALVSELPAAMRGPALGPVGRRADRRRTGAASRCVVEARSSTPRDLAGACMARALGRPLGGDPGPRDLPPLARHAPALDRGRRADARTRGRARAAAGSAPRRAPGRAHRERASRAGAVRPISVCADRLAAARHAGLARLRRRRSAWAVRTTARARRADPAETLLALSELELLGLLARGDGGRYVPRDPLPAWDQSVAGRAPAKRATMG